MDSSLAEGFRTCVLLMFGAAGVYQAVHHLDLPEWLVLPGALLVVICEVWHRPSAAMREAATRDARTSP